MDDPTHVGTRGASARPEERCVGDLPVVDIGQLLACLGGRETLAKTLAAAFIQGWEEQLVQLKTAHGEGNAAQFTLLAHRFKGNLSILRAERAHAAAEDLEEASRDGRSDDLERKIERLAVELQGVASTLAVWLEGM